MEKAIIGTLGELDPHSSYISAKDFKEMNEPLQGEFEGIGIEFAIVDDTLTVQATIAGGPSEKVGLMAGDRIIEVNGEVVASVNLTNKDVYGHLRGEKGSVARLTVIRPGVKGKLEFSIVRDKIPIRSVALAYEPRPGYLYLRLSRFAAKSHAEIVEEMVNMEGKMKGMILDLRGNTGGYLPTAIAIADEFLSKGDLILYTEGRSVPRMDEYATGRGFFQKGPLVIMVDENSASASEIVAGAIQDQDRGIIVGRRTFGKGLVQQSLPLEDGSELRLTIARYHTPSGRVIQSPYQAGRADRYYENFMERFRRGESFEKDSIQLPDSLKFNTLKRGRLVYGGGGIMPDLFIPKDTAYYTEYYAELLRKGVVPEFMNRVTDRNRVLWKSLYPDFDTFLDKYTVEKEMITDLADYGRSNGIEPDEEELARSAADLGRYMKALAAGSLFSSEYFYRVMNEGDRDFEKALEVLLSL